MKKKILSLFLITMLSFSSVLFVNAEDAAGDSLSSEEIIEEDKEPVLEDVEVEEIDEKIEEIPSDVEETPVPEENNESILPQEEIISSDKVEQVSEKETEYFPPDYTGKNEADISDEVWYNENVIIKYTVDENTEPGTILSQTNEDNNTVIEIASQPLITESKVSMNLLNAFDLFGEMTDEPTIEDNSWDNYPVSYEYNWDNSESAWQWGEWRDGVKYTTQEGTYDNNVRHAMGMYSDGENIHLHISYATIYQSIANGDDFNFYIDGQGAKVRVLYADDGSGITGQARQAGSYDLVVVNGDHWNSGYVANGSYGTMIIKDGNINNELEIVVPLSALKEQNSAINTDNIQNIEFFTPNLMYRKISCGGASSGPKGFVILSIFVFALPLVFKKKFKIFT